MLEEKISNYKRYLEGMESAIESKKEDVKRITNSPYYKYKIQKERDLNQENIKLTEYETQARMYRYFIKDLERLKIN
jgi:hypothetical protein